MAYTDNISRLSRLTAILLKLQSRPWVAVNQLAVEFEVSTRTIYRDILALEQAGVPIVSEEGKGFSLVAGYHIPPIMFTESEANALIVAEKLIAKSKDISLIKEFTKATDKIKSVLKHAEKRKAKFLSERTIIGKNWEDARSSATLSTLQTALTGFKVVEIHYQKANQNQSVLRKVEPFALYHNTSENWVLIAWCRLRNDFRTFRLDRIQRMRMLEEAFTPHEMSLSEYVEMQRIRFSQDPLT